MHNFVERRLRFLLRLQLMYTQIYESILWHTGNASSVATSTTDSRAFLKSSNAFWAEDARLILW